ncbi:glycosyltransferase [Sulfitobacter pontiacus]|uniref:glycosyltransferase n=1 Tax=Sulfitobacter pontiacus TaxID=60137 RepID=UPI0015DD960B|nr:glycosyltransferase [Sulfitobacter pontiacus]QLL44318.1 glycosyltransferase family 4 protein [Sulfitobacter pontiacus]
MISAALKYQARIPVETAFPALVLLAHHHCSGNIASQRFAGLVKYLPRDKHSVFIISGPATAEEHEQHDPELFVDSSPLLSKASIAARWEVLRHMALVRRNDHLEMQGNSWIAKAVNAARARIQSEKNRGKHPVVMATYSPIDALIAARLVAIAEDVPLIQDFRDGLAFENLGRPGALFKSLRKILEAWVVRPAAVITTVSRPLVRHFEKTYEGKVVSLLYNGFDAEALPEVAMPAQKQRSDKRKQTISIGHFGRISSSEAARLETLRMFISALVDGKFSGRLEFFGTLTSSEIAILNLSGLDCTFQGHVDRKVALEQMKEMSALIILTGKSESVATGKIYEYLFAGNRILIATQAKNEATRILEEIGDDDVIMDFSDPASIPPVEVLVEKLLGSFTRNLDAIKKFDKSVQAKEFSEILQRVAKAQV